MDMMKKKIISLILSITMMLSILSCLTACGGDDNGDNNGGGGNAERALVIMTDNPDGLFNPFFSTSAADAKIVAMTQIGMLTYGTDENDEVVLAYGDNESVAVKDFEQKYNDADDTTTYTFVIKNGIKFSDGHPLTIEDVLFNLYVYLDPVYTGSSTMYSTDIVGLADYRLQQHLGSGTSSADEALAEGARKRAQARINELINLFEKTAKTASGNFDTTYEDMVAAINSHNVSSGYKETIATPDEMGKIDFNKQLLADYTKALEYFKEELKTDFDTAKEAFTEKPYSEWAEFSDPIFCFMYYEGFATVKYADKDGKPNADKSKIISIEKNYDSSINTVDKAINHVFNSKINTKLNEILKYWATAQKLETEYMAKAKEVILRESMEDGELLIPNISGIVSLGHSQSAPDTITIGNNSYTVAKEHNADGTPKNADTYDVLEITINGIDPKAVWNFAFTVAPQHYYGEGAQTGVDIANNKFGVDYASFDFMTKTIQSHRNVTVPMGAGPYVATNASSESNPKGTDFFSNNVVYFKANNSFLLGAPKIDKVRYQVVSSTNALQALSSGSVHFVTPQLTPYNETTLAGMKSQGFESIQARQLGYGYIGINAGKVPNIYLRKAIMAAMDTSLARAYYSAGTVETIYWPMSTVSWAYPKDDSGNPDPINGYDYPAVNFSESAARATIQNYMALAEDHMGGYKDSDLKITFTIAGSNLTDHPSYSVFQSAAALLNSMGWDIEVIADTQALTKLTTGSLAVWAAAWGTTVDPDMYQVYHKNSTATSVYSWGYREILANPGSYSIENDILTDLSDLIDQARETDDRDERSELYREAMGYVLDLAVELPVYQRNELYAYNSKVIKSSSLPSDINPYQSPIDRIWEIEFAD